MGRLFRRVVRTARRPRRASRGSTVRSADGRQYRVVAVDEAENTEFADPPRKWGRIGLMAGVWAVALALGGWIAPGFAASGNPENVDSREEDATDAIGAAWSYLREGSRDHLDLSYAALCDGASPEFTPEDLDAMRQSYVDEYGGITDHDVTIDDQVPTSDGITLPATVKFVSDGNRPPEKFIVTVQENDGAYCVSNAVHLDEAEPTETEGTGETEDPKEVAAAFMRSFVGEDPDLQAAVASQCSNYTGIKPEELESAIAAWGPTESFLSSSAPAESSEASVAAFAIDVRLKRDLEEPTFSFVVEVQGDCVRSLTGGDGLF